MEKDMGKNTESMQTEKKECCCCSHKTKERTEKEYKDLLNRLSRIEGQVRGIRKMVETDCSSPPLEALRIWARTTSSTISSLRRCFR